MTAEFVGVGIVLGSQPITAESLCCDACTILRVGRKREQKRVPSDSLMSEISIATPRPLGTATPLSPVGVSDRKVRLPDTSPQEPLLAGSSIGRTAFRLGTTEPAAIAFLRETLGPAVVALSLAVCLWADGTRLSLETVALGVIVFLLAQRVLSTPEYQTGADGRRELLPTLPRLLLEWGCVFAVMIFLFS